LKTTLPSPGTDDSRAAHTAWKSRQWIGRVSLARRAGGIEKEQAVVHDCPCRRPEINRPDPCVAIEIQRNDKVSVNIRTSCRHLERLLHGHGQIRSPELPAFGEPRERGQASGIAFDGTVGHPPLDRGDLICRQLPRIRKRVIAGARFPRRHRT
jgi:hypothetical protein